MISVAVLVGLSYEYTQIQVDQSVPNLYSLYQSIKTYRERRRRKTGSLDIQWVIIEVWTSVVVLDRAVESSILIYCKVPDKTELIISTLYKISLRRLKPALGTNWSRDVFTSL